VTISTFMRRTAAIGATVVAISGFAAGQALASTSQASAPGHAKVVATAIAAARTFSPEASGGGCSPPDFISACISVSGNWVLPDAYVNSLPYGCSTIGFLVWDLTSGGYPVQATIGCHTGHFGHSFPGTPGHIYQTIVVYSYDNYAGTITFRSPYSYF
jgi:hypothetical protein